MSSRSDPASPADIRRQVVAPPSLNQPERSRSPDRRQIVFVLAGLAILTAAAVWRWRAPEVAVVQPTRGNAAAVVYATGLVEPRSWAKVAALQRKRIVEMCDCEGKTVRKGDVLARLDDIEERAVLSEIEARVNRTKEDVDRLKGLLDRNVTSRVAYDDKLTLLRELEARVRAQKDRIFDLELRAPIDGVVLRRDGEVGELTGTGPNDILFWVGQPKPLRIVAEVNEDDIAKIKPNQKVLLRHEGFPGAPISATVDDVTLKGDPATKTFRVYFALPDTTPLMIGMSVEANIIVREVTDTWLIPATAVSNNGVWVVVSGRLERRPVVTGIKSDRMVEILSGIAPDERVVSSPLTNPKEGQAVRPTGMSAP
jgi:RND family efflux transporter MFP subunit